MSDESTPAANPDGLMQALGMFANPAVLSQFVNADTATAFVQGLADSEKEKLGQLLFGLITAGQKDAKKSAPKNEDEGEEPEQPVLDLNDPQVLYSVLDGCGDVIHQIVYSLTDPDPQNAEQGGAVHVHLTLAPNGWVGSMKIDGEDEPLMLTRHPNHLGFVLHRMMTQLKKLVQAG
jgi:hypothetical protein